MVDLAVPSTHAPAHGAPTPWPRTLATALGLVVGLTLLLVAFAWPAVRSSVHGVPLGVAGPAPAVAQVQAALEKARPGAFVVTALADRAAAETAIRDRRVYGAVVVGQPGQAAPAVLTASAASPAVAAALSQLAQALQAAPTAGSGQATGQATGQAAGQAAAATQRGATVVDVVALPAADPRGAGLAAGALPLVLGGIATAGAVTAAVRGAARRFVAAAVVSVGAGLMFAVVLQPWLGVLSGSFWRNAGVLVLAVAAIAYPLLGLEWLIGIAGLALGAAVTMLLGNPLSGLTSAPEMLPDGWGSLGQLLQPGATGSLLRSVAYFDGAGAGRPLTVLLAWLAAGLAVCAVAAARRRQGPAAGPSPSRQG